MPQDSQKRSDWQELTRLTQGEPITVERVRLAERNIAIEGSFDRFSPIKLDYDVSQQAKIDFDSGHHRHRLAVLGAGLELPLADGLKRLFIQAEPEAADDSHVLSGAVGGNGDRDYDGSLILCGACLFAVIRFDL